MDKKTEQFIGVEDVKKFLEDAQIENVQREFMNRIWTLVIASFAVITALAWDDFLRDVFAVMFQKESTVMQKLYYALTVTLVAAVVSVMITKYSKRTNLSARKK